MVQIVDCLFYYFTDFYIVVSLLTIRVVTMLIFLGLEVYVVDNCILKHFQHFHIAFTPHNHKKLCRKNISNNNATEQS